MKAGIVFSGGIIQALKALHPSLQVLPNCNRTTWTFNQQCRRFCHQTRFHTSSPASASMKQSFDPRLRKYLLMMKEKFDNLHDHDKVINSSDSKNQVMHSFKDLKALITLTNQLLKAENDMKELADMDGKHNNLNLDFYLLQFS